MSWIARKVETWSAAVCAAATGMAVSQVPAFLAQYLQRLGGHLDEARLAVHSATALPGTLGAPSPDALGVLIARLQDRADHLAQAHDAITQAGPWMRPFVFLAHADWAIAERTLAQFQPALPLDSGGVTALALGLVLGLVLFDLLKLPFVLLAARSGSRRRRLFDTHGNA